MDTTFIAERQNGLQNYVNFILAHPVLARHISVKRFLDPVNYSCDFQGTRTQSLCDKWNPLSGLSSIQNILGHVIKLGVRTNLAKLAHIVPLIMLVILVIQI